MINSRSGINLIKQKFLQPNIKINNKEILPLKGIASEIVSTLGSVEISLVGHLIKFHLLSDSTHFPYDGILGNKFLRDKSVTIDYKNKCLRYDNTEIPFVKSEKIQVKRRSVIPFYINITNPEKRVGYIPRSFIADNIYLGDVIVTNTNGRAYLKLFNTSEKEYEIEVPYMELQDFEIAKSSDVIETRGHTMISEITEARELPVIYETSNQVNNSICVELLNLVNNVDVRGLPVPNNSLKSVTLKSLGDNKDDSLGDNLEDSLGDIKGDRIGDIKGTRGLPTMGVTNNNINTVAIDNPI